MKKVLLFLMLAAILLLTAVSCAPEAPGNTTAAESAGTKSAETESVPTPGSTTESSADAPSSAGSETPEKTELTVIPEPTFEEDDGYIHSEEEGWGELKPIGD